METDLKQNDGRKYHHGNLRKALLEAAEHELKEKGPDKFSLRGVAKRAGVSHAAPAHHFNDVDGLLTALTAISFERFTQHMNAYSERADNDADARLIAIGLAYIDYASKNQALFDMQFTSSRINHCAPEMEQATPQAYTCLVQHIQASLQKRNKDLQDNPDIANSYWALCHGLATLFSRQSTEKIEMSGPDKDQRLMQILSDFVKKL